LKFAQGLIGLLGNKKMSQTLQSLRARKENRRRLLEKELEKIVEHLRAMGALKIIIFGSYAQGHVRSSSDLDILAVMPSTMKGKDWMSRIYEETDREADSDILAFTPQELEEAISVSRFLRHVMETGRVIYENGSQG
jgi:predicted nucleotidyltransferase